MLNTSTEYNTILITMLIPVNAKHFDIEFRNVQCESIKYRNSARENKI